MIAYKTSRDYKRLKELLDAGNEVVCFFTHDWEESMRMAKDYKPNKDM